MERVREDVRFLLGLNAEEYPGDEVDIFSAQEVLRGFMAGFLSGNGEITTVGTDPESEDAAD